MGLKSTFLDRVTINNSELEWELNVTNFASNKVIYLGHVTIAPVAQFYSFLFVQLSLIWKVQLSAV